MAITVNHILSSKRLESGIFNDLIQRFCQLGGDAISAVVSERPLPGAHVHHYHRPNRECRLKPNSIVTVHHDLGDPYGWLDIDTFLPRYREAGRVVCLNRRQATMLEGLGVGRLAVIPHGADESLLTPSPLPALNSGGKMALAMVSKRYPRGVKGEERLQALMERLDPRRFRFMFIGEGRWQDAEAARALGFEAQQFEALPYRLMGQAYREIDAVLILSHYEGGPACLPEALACGRPVIATEVGMVPDLIENESNGLIISGDARTDAPRIADLADLENGRLARLAGGARHTEVPGWGAVFAEYARLYHDIAGTIRGGGN